MKPPCRTCRTPRPPRTYLCRNCWNQLPTAAQTALTRRDTQAKARARLRELHRQLDAGVALTEIQVTP